MFRVLRVIGVKIEAKVPTGLWWSRRVMRECVDLG